MSRKQRNSTSYSCAFEVRLCLGSRPMSRSICDKQELVVSVSGYLQDVDQDKEGN